MHILRYLSPECVMVRVPKTGSTSIVKGLLGGVEEAEEVLLGEFPPHWRSLYSFAFVRNPFDRLVSAFHMFQGYNVTTEAEEKFRSNLTLARMMDVVEDNSISPAGGGYFGKLKLHCLPMTSPLFHLSEVREVYRFERFQTEYRKLARKLGRICSVVPHWRQSQREPYQSYFTATDRARFEAVYQADLGEFGYTF